jgi:hypothetical protein
MIETPLRKISVSPSPLRLRPSVSGVPEVQPVPPPGKSPVMEPTLVAKLKSPELRA